jgi:hypothetical protein
MIFDNQTIRRMSACFAGQTCCKCGHKAVRLAHRRFYCQRHFPPVRAADVVPKVYRCVLTR